MILKPQPSTLTSGHVLLGAAVLGAAVLGAAVLGVGAAMVTEYVNR